VVGAALHRYALYDTREGRRIVAALPGSASASSYAAPARATDLSGLPPAYITSAEFDPNRDEAITYAVRLLQAGVPVELHQWPGTFHGSQAILSAEVSHRQTAELAAALRRALAESGPFWTVIHEVPGSAAPTRTPTG
jgi:acetyl esterase/lipase